MLTCVVLTHMTNRLYQTQTRTFWKMFLLFCFTENNIMHKWLQNLSMENIPLNHNCSYSPQRQARLYSAGTGRRTSPACTLGWSPPHAVDWAPCCMSGGMHCSEDLPYPTRIKGVTQIMNPTQSIDTHTVEEWGSSLHSFAVNWDVEFAESASLWNMQCKRLYTYAAFCDLIRFCF